MIILFSFTLSLDLYIAKVIKLRVKRIQLASVRPPYYFAGHTNDSPTLEDWPACVDGWIRAGGTFVWQSYGFPAKTKAPDDQTSYAGYLLT